MPDRSDRLFGRYEVERELGQGGTGRVYLARDLASRGRRVALKLLQPGQARDPRARETLRNEFRTLASLRHPALARVFDYGTDEETGAAYLAEEFVQGRDLLHAAARLTPTSWRTLFVQAARALECIHARGLVHFDVKPENLIVLARGGRPALKLVDFGIAGAVRREARTAGQPLRGTRPYVAPEAWRGEAIDARADLFALGVAFHRALAGHFPDGGDAADLPVWFRSILPRLLDPAPARRFQSARELIAELSRLGARLVAIETAEERRQRIRGGPLVGRRRELEALGHEVDALASRKEGARLIGIRGGPGSGKSRLLGEFRVACRLRGLTVLGGPSSDAPRPDEPYPILASWIREASSIGRPREGVANEALRSIAPDLFGKARAPERLAVAADGAPERRLRDGVVAWLRETLRGRAVVLLADDLDHADPSTLDVLSLLLRLGEVGYGMPRLLVVAGSGDSGPSASRANEIAASLRDLGLAREMRLRPLGVPEVARWISGQLGSEAKRLASAVKRLARVLASRSSGNPGALEEELTLILDDKRCDLTTLLESESRPEDLCLSLPASLKSGWRDRLAGMDPVSRSILGALAIAARPTPLDVVTEGPEGPSTVTVHTAAEELERRGLIEHRESLWSLSAGSLRDAVLDELSGDEARACHDACYSALRRAASPDPIALARHALGAAAEDRASARRAASEALRAARERRAREAFSEAGSILRSLVESRLSLPHRTRARALVLSGDLVAAQGEWERALGLYREAERFLDEPRATFDRRMGDALRERGEYREAESRLLRALASGSLAIGSIERARTHLSLGLLRLLEGKPEDSRAEARRGLSAEGRPLSRAEAHLWNLLGMAAFRCGDAGEAERSYSKALRRFERARDSYGAAGVLNNLAVLRTQEGRFVEAARLHRRALSLWERLGNPAKEAMSRNNVALAALARGGLASARALLERSLQIRRALGEGYGEASSLGNLGVCLREEGRLAESRVALSTAQKKFAALGNRREEALLLAHSALLEIALGRPARAAALAGRALDRLSTETFPRERTVALVAAGRAALEKGDGSIGRARLEEARSVARAARSRAWEAEAAMHLVEAALRRGDDSAARCEIVAVRRALAGTDLFDVRVRLAAAALSLARLDGRPVGSRAADRVASLAGRSERAEARLGALAVLGESAADAGELKAAARFLAEAAAVVSAQARGLKPADARRVRSRREHARILRLYEGIRRRATASADGVASRLQTRALMKINRALLSEPDPEKLLGRILDAAIEISGAERGFVILRGATGLRFPVAHNFEKRSLERASSEVSHSFVSRVLETGRTWAAEDTGSDERLRKSRSLLDLGAASLIAVPLRAAEAGVSGALYLDHRRQAGLFAGETRALLEAFADQAALALECRRRQREIEELNQRLTAGLEERTRELEGARTALDVARRELSTKHGSVADQSHAMRSLLAVVDRVAPTDLTIAISGESGSGKDHIARAIHARSRRADRPFVAVDCAALPDPLVESELFGHCKGAFTGADRDQKGLFEQASGGTIYLDDVAALSPSAQGKILRVLETREVRPIGRTTSRKVHVRWIASSVRPLEEEVARGRFREDLFFRLKEVVIRVPPLRERREDVPALVERFLEEVATEPARGRRSAKRFRFSKEAMARLLDYPWPGNVRELKNEVRRAVLLGGEEISTEILSPEVRAGGGALPSGEEITAERFQAALRETEAALVKRALQAARGNQTRAAKLLGLSRFGLRKKIARLGM